MNVTNNYHFEAWRLFDPFYLIYCIPVTIHYFLVLRIIRNVTESNAFFSIFYIVGVVDFFYCTTMLACEFMHYTDFLPIFVFVTFVVFSYFGVFFNLLSNALLAINRFCATSVSYNTYFEKSRIKRYFFVVFVVSAIATIPGGTVMFWYYYADWSLAKQYYTTGIRSFSVHRTIVIALLLINGILGLVLNAGTMYRLRKLNINYDKSLLLVTSLHIFPEALVVFFNLDMTLMFTGEPILSNERSRVCLFFLVSFDSLTIVCTNRMIRRHYFRSFVTCIIPKYKLSKRNTSVVNVVQITDRITIL